MGNRLPAEKMRPTCTVQAACDGNVLTRGRELTGICAKCEKARELRAKPVKLRGGPGYE